MEGEEQESRPVASGRRRRHVALLVGAALAGVVVLITIAWVVDTSALGGQVVRNVELAGHDIGGLAEDDLPEVVADVGRRFDDREVRIVTPGPDYTTTAGEIGLGVDVAATADAALDLGRTEAFPLRPVRWLASFVEQREAPLRFRVSETAVSSTLIDLQGDGRVAPVEPTIEAGEDGFSVVAGEPGRGLDAGQVARLLPAAAVAAENDAIVIRVAPGPISPVHDEADAEALADRATELTRRPITVEARGLSAEVDVAVLRSWVTATATDDGLDLDLDADHVVTDLAGVLGPFGDAPRDARFVVEGGVPKIVPSTSGVVCCADGSADRILAALREGTTSVELEVVTKEPEFTTGDARALRITEEIGAPDEFGPTTRHACCETRVNNIHRIADIIRGVVIKPGETFSVNAYVGQRTRAKGFLPGGAIVNGVVDQQIGGGVSQFATTLFNAALYAGLEFGEYQSHSLYIDRYPRGHEATISWPHPDLQIKNPTPYGVLVWPTYTDTSITVRLYSTKHYRSVVLGVPTASRAGRCTRWTTPRTRVLPDGARLRDSVSATYRPGEGIDC